MTMRLVLTAKCCNSPCCAVLAPQVYVCVTTAVTRTQSNSMTTEVPCAHPLQWPHPHHTSLCKGQSALHSLVLRMWYEWSQTCEFWDWLYIPNIIPLRNLQVVAHVNNPFLLSGLSAGLIIKRSWVWFPVRAHAWVASQVPGRGRMRSKQHINVSLSFSLPSPLSKNKQLKNLLKSSILFYCWVACPCMETLQGITVWLTVHLLLDIFYLLLLLQRKLL